MTERLKFMGRLEEKNLQVKNLKLKIEGLVKSMREHLDPTEPVEDLRLDLVSQQALEAADNQIELKALLEEIKVIKKLLGR